MNRFALIVLKNLRDIPMAYGRLCHCAKHVNEYSDQERWILVQSILKRAVDTGNVKLNVFGHENIPNKNGFLMYGNHQGLFDVVAVAASCDTPLGAIFKKELINVPLVKQITICTKSFAMDREDIRQSMKVIQAVTNEVCQGKNYLIFPEGTRSKEGNQMLDFHSGSFRCALKAKCPIIPIALIDSYKVLDQKGSKPVTVQIHYLQPILYQDYKGMTTKELATLVQSRIHDTIRAFACTESEQTGACF